ncbi:RICIN domain-containing protein [Streptomyces roseolilacinus]|uniref:RICIN domain-containing protein n=1 Tax=Streptomyces roseolilacinus TaxID=66904 RepID=UPI0037F334D2
MNHQPHGGGPHMGDPDATELLPPVRGAYPPADAYGAAPSAYGAAPSAAHPPANAYGPPPPAACPPDAYGPPPVDATRPLPRIEDEPPSRPSAPRRTRGGPPRAALVAAAIVVCAVAGLAIGAVLGGPDEDAPEAAPAAGTAPAATPSGAPGQAPSPTPTPSPSATRPPVPTGTFVLVDPATGRAADVQGGAANDGAPVIAWERHAQPNQQWRLDDTGDGHVRIRAVHSGLCLQPADPLGPGAVVVQRPCVDGDAQHWVPAPTADAATHTFTLKGWGLALAPAGPENGSPVSLQAPDAANPRGWALQAP